LAVIERHFEELTDPAEPGNAIPHSNIRPQLIGFLLETEGFMLVGEFKGINKSALLTEKRSGPEGD
jgi:hypothetical protein